MTPERKAELRRLAEAATPGPWGRTLADFVRVGDSTAQAPGNTIEESEINAAYIVAACNAIRELLDELEGLEKRIRMADGLAKEIKRENRGLAAQAAVLRDCLEDVLDPDVHSYCEYDCGHPKCGYRRGDVLRAQAVLADTVRAALAAVGVDVQATKEETG